ncbi:hypothetical protein [Amycolatopsis sp. NPDC051903]|uniref:hypothetical protein n=1 Tax=Amycolatopsis sp. NPDC051903 TaxID=3363936 RepID=UPI00379F9FC9
MTTSHEATRAIEPSDADYLGHSHEQLQQFVTTNLDPKQVADVAAAYSDVQKAFEEFATQLTEAVNKSAGAWEGDAATNAHAYFETLGKWADATAQNAKAAAQSVDEQSAAAQTARNSMTEPIPFDWNDEFKHWTDAGPFDLGDAVDKSLRKQQDSQAAHEQAAQTMATYDQSLHAAASQQPTFADPPKFASASGSPASTVLPSASVDHHGGGASGGSSTGSHDVSGASQITGSGHLPAGPNSATTSASVTPAAAQQQPGGGNAPAGGAMPMGGMPMGGAGMGGGFGADEEHQSKFGRGGGFGPGEGVSAGLGSADTGMGRGLSGAPARMGMGGAARYEEDEDDGSRFFAHVDEDSEYGADLRAAPPVIGE